MGKQAIDDDSNQTGQMLAATRLGGHVRSKVVIEGEGVSVTREVVDGLPTVKLKGRPSSPPTCG